jgi:type I restriction-modification system DNA methylase subunit
MLAPRVQTPHHVIGFVVDEIAPRPGNVGLDPACGPASLLLAGREHRGEAPGRCLGDACDRITR